MCIYSWRVILPIPLKNQSGREAPSRVRRSPVNLSLSEGGTGKSPAGVIAVEDADAKYQSSQRLSSKVSSQKMLMT